MSELKPCPCPICGAELKIYSPEDWAPTFYDPDSGGDPYAANCDCGFSFQRNDYDYVEFIAALNRRAQPDNDPLTLEALRGMDGEPVWVMWPDKRIRDKWWLVGSSSWYIMDFFGEELPSGCLETWRAYRRKPEPEGGEEG